MTSTANIENYGIFSREIVATLNAVAERLGQLSYDQAVKEFKVPEPETFPVDGHKSIEVVDAIPKGGYDSTLVIQAEFGTGMDPNAIMHLIPLIGSLPTTRIIAHGQPTGWWNRNNLLTTRQAWQVSSGDLSPLAILTLAYMKANPHKRVDEAVHAGFSLGADIVPEIPSHAERFNHAVSAVISADGVTGHARPFLTLGRNFMSTQKAWKFYMAQVESPAFTEARKLGHNDNPLFVASAFSRLSTLAIAGGLAKGGMESRLEAALTLEFNSAMKAIILNCGNSELSNARVMDYMRDRLQAKFGKERVLGSSLPGLRHAVNDQIFANAAIILHGLEIAA